MDGCDLSLKCCLFNWLIFIRLFLEFVSKLKAQCTLVRASRQTRLVRSHF